MAMEISAIGSVGEEAANAARASQMHVQSYALSVQRAVGPKEYTGYGVEGRVLVAFSLGGDGALATLRVARSSGYDRLDSAALQIVGNAVFPTPPPHMKVAGRTFLSALSFK